MPHMKQRTENPLSHRNSKLCALFLALSHLILLIGCGSGGGSSKPSTPYRLVQSVQNGYWPSIGLTRSGEILTIQRKDSDRPIIRLTPQSDGQYSVSTFSDRRSDAMAISPVSGRVFSLRYSVDRWEIDVFDGTGTLLGSKLITPEQSHSSSPDVAVNNRGDVFVCLNVANTRCEVIRMDEDGRRLGSFAPEGVSGFIRLTTDTDGNLAFIAPLRLSNGGEVLAVSVRVYSPDGTLLRNTPLETLPGGSPIIGSDGKLYTAGGLNPSTVSVYNYQTGRLLVQQRNLVHDTQNFAVGRDGTLYLLGSYVLRIYRPNR